MGGTMTLCEKCGGKCCLHVIVTVKDIEQYRDFAETRGELRGGRWWINSPCRYLADGKCTIYDRRPVTCREYEVDGPMCRETREMLGGPR